MPELALKLIAENKAEHERKEDAKNLDFGTGLAIRANPQCGKGVFTRTYQ